MAFPVKSGFWRINGISKKVNFEILVVKKLEHIYNMDICLNIENINNL